MSFRERALILTLAAVATLAAGGAVLKRGLDEFSDRLEVQADVIHQLMSQRLSSSVGVLTSLSGLQQGSDELDDAQLTAISEQLRTQYPHLRFIAYLSEVPDEERGWFERSARHAGLMQFAIRDHEPGAVRGPVAARRPRYLPVSFLDPLEPLSARWLGVDLSTVPGVEQMLEPAVESAASIIRLGRFLDHEGVTLGLLRATYFGHFVPTAAEERRTQLRGAFLLGVDLNRMLHDLVSPTAPARLTLSSNPGTAKEQFYRRGDPSGTRDARPSLFPRYAALRWITLSGNRLLLELQASPNASELPTGSAAAAMGLVGCLSWGLVWMLGNRRSSRRKLEESREQFRNLFEGSIQGIVIHRQLQLLFVNRSFAEMLGYRTPAAVLARGSLLDLLPVSEHARVSELDLALLEGRRGPGQIEIEALRANGSRVTLVNSASAISWDGQPAVQSTVIDITERKRAEQELIAVRDRALAAARAKSAFLANMSHELRTPMNGVLGTLELLRAGGVDADQQELVSIAMTSGEALLALINDVLDFSRLEVGKLKLNRVEFELLDAVETVVERLAPIAHRKGIDLACRVTPTPVALRGDPQRLQQILINLIGNAIKFTAAGEVTVEVSAEAPSGGRIELRFDVVDTGIGVEAEKHAQIFESFTQADDSTTRRFGGSGLGLAISRELVTQMGGRIALDSTPGQGSRFWFTAVLDALPDPAPAPPRFSGCRAWVLDPCRVSGRAIADHLEADGLEVGVPDTVETLAAWLEGGAPAPQVILLDPNWDPSWDPSWPGAGDVPEDPRLGSSRRVLLQRLGETGPGPIAARGARRLLKPVRRHALRSCVAGLLGARAPTVAGRGERDEPGPRKEPEAVQEGVGRLLLVEDNEVNQRVASSVLSALGYQIDVAADGEQALEALARQRYDLVLMDCQMPKLDGYETTRRIRLLEEPLRSIPIVALTANALDGDAERCLEAGMDDYLSKPVRASALSEKLARWLPGSAAGGELTSRAAG